MKFLKFEMKVLPNDASAKLSGIFNFGKEMKSCEIRKAQGILTTKRNKLLEKRVVRGSFQPFIIIKCEFLLSLVFVEVYRSVTILQRSR